MDLNDVIRVARPMCHCTWVRSPKVEKPLSWIWQPIGGTLPCNRLPQWQKKNKHPSQYWDTHNPHPCEDFVKNCITWLIVGEVGLIFLLLQNNDHLWTCGHYCLSVPDFQEAKLMSAASGEIPRFCMFSLTEGMPWALCVPWWGGDLLWTGG